MGILDAFYGNQVSLTFLLRTHAVPTAHVRDRQHRVLLEGLPRQIAIAPNCTSNKD